MAELNHVAEVLTVRNPITSEGGGIGRRAGFRLQDQSPNAPLFLSETPHGRRPQDVTERPQSTHFGHGDRHENGAVALSDVQRAAAALLHRVADGGKIPIAVLHGFAELVLRSEMVLVSRQVLEGPPEFAVRRALELASLVLGVRVVDEIEKGRAYVKRAGKKRKTRTVSLRIDEDDFARLDALAMQTSCSRGEVLRRCLAGAELKSTINAQALTEVSRVHANLNRVGGLLKLAIREGVSDSSTSHRLNLELIDSVMEVRRAVNRSAWDTPQKGSRPRQSVS